jgi:hypothetical protein
MKRLWKNIVLSAAVVLFAGVESLPAQTPSAGGRPAKKFIEYGWDVTVPDQVRKNIREMEKKPFDGVIFKLRERNHAFDPRPWNEAELKPEFDNLAAIEWKTFTDNFLCLYAANNWKMDWFNDEQWKHIAANLRLSAKAAKIGRCVGVVFDPEPYGENPWAFPGMHKDRSFDEMQAQVFKRGAQFISAIQDEMPNARVLTFFHQSAYPEAMDDPDPKKRAAVLAKQDWALLSAFWNGALSGAAPNARIVDGNELSYYYTGSEPFFRAFHLMKHRSLSLVPPELWAKHAVNFQAGMAVYIDELVATRHPPGEYLSYYIPKPDQLRWVEHNVYHALETSEEYVWCYSERMNWWENKMPEGVEAAIVSARKKIAEGKPLGFNIDDLIAAGQKNWAAVKQAKDKKK